MSLFSKQVLTPDPTVGGLDTTHMLFVFSFRAGPPVAGGNASVAAAIGDNDGFRRQPIKISFVDK